jgi:hypothetical protein
MREIFQARKQEVLANFDFDIVTVALRATKFGWAKHVTDWTDAQIEERSRRFASGVLDNAIEYVLDANEMTWSGCGGFKATAWPHGGLLLEFVLADADACDDEAESPAMPVQSSNGACPMLISGPRRILKLQEKE